MWRWVVGGLLIALLAACGTEDTKPENKQASDTLSTTRSLVADRVTTLAISGGVGDVTIHAGAPAGELQITYTRTAYGTSDQDAREELDDVLVQITTGDDRVLIDTRQRATNTSQRTNRVDLAIAVPDAITLDVSVLTGSITISGVTVPGGLDARTFTGNLRVENVQVPDGMILDAKAGDLYFGGSLGDAGTYEIGGGVGTVTLDLPANTSARLDARATVGSIRAADLVLDDRLDRGEGTGAVLRGILGQGGPPLTVTVNVGDIIFRSPAG